jgi:hypothetical protein
VRGDEGRVMTPPPSRPEARSRLGSKTNWRRGIDSLRSIAFDNSSQKAL